MILKKGLLCLIFILLLAVFLFFIILINQSPNRILIIEEIKNVFRIPVSLPIENSKISYMTIEDYYDDGSIITINAFEGEFHEICKEIKEMSFGITTRDELHGAEASMLITVHTSDGKMEDWVVLGDIFICKDNADIVYRIKGLKSIRERLLRTIKQSRS